MGNINDLTVAPALVEAARGRFTCLLADRGYDTNAIRALLARYGTEAVIPSTRTRKASLPYSRAMYRGHYRVENLWCRLKDWRRVAPSATFQRCFASSEPRRLRPLRQARPQLPRRRPHRRHHHLLVLIESGA